MHSINRYIICTIFTSLVFCQTLDIETLERLVVDGNPYLNGRFAYLDVVDAQRMCFESSEQYIGALKYYYINIL